jgi:hypothetical protein
MGEWGNGGMGEWESGRVGEWERERGRVGECESATDSLFDSLDSRNEKRETRNVKSGSLVRGRRCETATVPQL